MKVKFVLSKKFVSPRDETELMTSIPSRATRTYHLAASEMDKLDTPLDAIVAEAKPKKPAQGHRRGGRPPPQNIDSGRDIKGDISMMLDSSLDDVIASDKPPKNPAQGHRRGSRPPPGQGGKAPRGDNKGRSRGDGRGRSTKAPYGTTEHRRSVSDIALAPSGERTLKVSATTDPRKLAGSIVLVCEAGEAPMLLPLGAQCVNQAVKAIAIARRDLLEIETDQTFLSCFPDFRDEGKRTVSMQCDKETKGPWASSTADLTVASGTTPATAAGAIAGKIREGKKVAVRACGAQAVSNTVSAVAHARQYLKDEGIDVFFVPEFEKEQNRDGNERTVVLFKVCKAAGSAATGNK